MSELRKMKKYKKFPCFFFLYFIIDPSAIAKETLLNEIRTLKQAGKHPNIVTLIGTRIEEGKSVFDDAMPS